jgi:hypothetical protein
VTRRIVLALMAFTAAVIAGAVVPLALNAMGHDRNSFTQATVAAARTDAAVAQSRLDYLYGVTHKVNAGGGVGATTPGDPPLINVLRQVE